MCGLIVSCFNLVIVSTLSSKQTVLVYACSEWAVNIHRDSYASYVGHHPVLAYFAVAENESIGRERYNFMQVHVCTAVSRTIRINGNIVVLLGSSDKASASLSVFALTGM